MNRTKIEWCDWTWNPVTGCEHGCPYCYARRMQARFGKTPKARKFQYEFHLDRMDGPKQAKVPGRIFVVSMGDLFGEWVPSPVIFRVVSAAIDTPRHVYMFLTKNVIRMGEFLYGNCLQKTTRLWFGGSATNQQEFEGRVGYLIERGIRNVWVSVEPMLGPVRLGVLRPRWVVIGAQTGPGKKELPRKWVVDLVNDCHRTGVHVFVKDNAPWGPLKTWGARPHWTPKPKEG